MLLFIKRKVPDVLFITAKKIVLLRVMEVGKIILKKKRPLLLARSLYADVVLVAHSAAQYTNDAVTNQLQTH